MAARHKSRERALQVLYQWDLLGHSIDRSIESYYEFFSSPEEEHPPAPDPFMVELVQGVAARVQEIDAGIVRHSAHWRIERMPAVDRNILRLAIFEMIAGISPAAIAIDEALKLAKRFSGDESIPFINGVLDAIRKEREGEAA
ncbi:MAG: transcription antitermination factor NusB [Acidobacteriales bacterium]|nr:transcription antitermination factor NusB [Terriglobales bacterium]